MPRRTIAARAELTTRITVRIAATAPALLVAAWSATTLACEGTACATGIFEQRLGRALADTTTQRQLQERISGKAYDPAAHGHAPLDIGQKGDGAIVGSSIAGIRAYMSAEDKRRLENAAALVPDGLTLPEPKPALPNRFDVWTVTEFNGLTAADTQAVTGRVGADYRLKKGTVIGASIEGENRRAAAVENEGFLAGPYLATEIAPGVSFTARSAWGLATGWADNLASPAEADRELHQAGIDANWKLGKTTLNPKASFTHAREAAADGGLSVETRKLTFNPRVARPFELETGERIEAYVDFTAGLNVNEVEVGANAIDNLDAEHGIGAGVTVSRKDSYAIKATTDVKGLGEDDKRAFGANLKLDVPLN